MTAKTVQLSTRVTHEDAAFLATLQMEGATTPSDKLRALIAEARRRHEAPNDFAGSLQLMRDLLGPALQRFVEAESLGGGRSELVHLLGDWLAESTAQFLSGAQKIGEAQGSPAKQLTEMERTLAQQVFVLIEAVLRMGVTTQAPCYDKSIIAQKVGPTLELAEVVKERTQR